MTKTTDTDDDEPEFEVVDSRTYIFEDGKTFVVKFVGERTITPQITGPDAETSDAHSWCGTGRKMPLL